MPLRYAIIRQLLSWGHIRIDRASSLVVSVYIRQSHQYIYYRDQPQLNAAVAPLFSEYDKLLIQDQWVIELSFSCGIISTIHVIIYALMRSATNTINYDL